MKFNIPLREALFLQRKSVNMIEADCGGVKISLLCPNNNKLLNSAVLGSRIWYTPEQFIPSYCPAIWQLSEIDYGHIVCINDNLSADLFIEAYHNKTIKILNADHKSILLQPNQYLPGDYCYDFSLIDKQTGHTEGFVITKSTTSEVYPEAEFSPEIDIKDELYTLIHARLLGYRAILCCFVFIAGVDKLNLTRNHHPEYASLLAKAMELGVEIIAYGTNPEAKSIEVTSPVQIISELH